MIKKSNLWWVILLYLAACKNNPDTSTDSAPLAFTSTSQFKLDSISYFDIPLDTQTPVDIQSLNYFSSQEKNFLAFLNTMNNSVYLYDYDQRKVLKKISLNVEGPNGVGDLTGVTIQGVRPVLE